MTELPQPRKTIRFGVFEVDPKNGELRKQGVRVKLQDLPLRFLVALLERPGEIVSREELIARLWSDGTHVDHDQSLGAAVYAVRQALGDSADNPRFVETAPRRGYRFIGGVDPPRATVPTPTRPLDARDWTGYVVLAFVCLSAGAGLYHYIAAAPEVPKSVRRFNIRLPERTRESPFPEPDVAISPNGRFVAFVSGERLQLLVQDLEEDGPRVIQDVEEVRSPFWSPDSQNLLFAAGSELKRVSVKGGTLSTVCPLPKAGSIFGGTVSPDGSTIVFASKHELFEVPIGGGSARPVHSEEEREQIEAQLGGSNLLTSPRFLRLAAGDRILMFTAGFSATRKIIQNLETRHFSDLGVGCKGSYSPTGHLVYEHDSDLWAVPFSIERLKLLGEPFPIRENAVSPTVATDGTLVYKECFLKQVEFAVRDRKGRRIDTIGEPAAIHTSSPIRISPDGRRFSYLEADGNLWFRDVGRGTSRPIAMAPGVNLPGPWSPDSKLVAFSSNRNNEYDIFLKDPERTDGPQRLTKDPAREMVSGWSRSGNLLYRKHSSDGNRNLWYSRKDSGGSWAQYPFLETESDETGGRFSPDGRHVVFRSNASDRDEVYVRAFPDGERNILVSTNGGNAVSWSADGSEIFYVEPSENGHRLMAVPVLTQPEFRRGKPTEIFRLATANPYAWDVFPDGQRFLIAEPAGRPPEPRIRIVQNWYEEFRDQLER